MYVGVPSYTYLVLNLRDWFSIILCIEGQIVKTKKVFYYLCPLIRIYICGWIIVKT